MARKNNRGLDIARAASIAMLVLCCQNAWAMDVDLGLDGWTANWDNRITIGAAIREEKQNPDLIGKSNLNPNLCRADECLTADPSNNEPNDRYLAAPGAKNSVYDEGDLNYQQWDFVSAPVKWTTYFSAEKDNLKFKVGALAFYDIINANLKEYHPNEVTTPGPESSSHPVYSKRAPQTLRDIGYNVQLLDTYVQDTFDIYGHPLDVSIGRQRLTWGESSFVTQGSLNIINPPDVNNLVRPGMDLSEVYRPEGMLVLRAPLTDDLTSEGFYQFEWRPAALPARGSFISFFNAGNEVTQNEGIIAPFAKTPYDPQQIGTPANPVFALLTNTSFTLRRSANHNPKNTGQYGLALYYHPLWLQGSEVGFYAANYHSRIPSASASAADASCLRREGNPNNNDATDITSLINDCGVPGAHQREAVPIDTVHYFLDYPENIHLFGLSFSSIVDNIAVRGEFAYRPNQPVQVDLEDVLFAALQPALPRQDIPLFGVGTNTTLPGLISALQNPANILNVASNQLANLPTAITALQTLATAQNPLSLTVPGSRRIPDFVTAYRGGTPGEVTPGQYIRGYERLKVMQGSLALTKIFGDSDFLGTKDSALLFEATGIGVLNLPPLSQIQFEGPGTDTPYGPGAFDSGNNSYLSPIHNSGGYVTAFSYGYRLGALLHYSDVLIPGLDMRPFLVFTHDVHGVSPGLGENFLQGRKLGVVDIRFSYHQFDASLTQTFIFGGGNRNTLNDRDFFSASVGVRF